MLKKHKVNESRSREQKANWGKTHVTEQRKN